MRARVWAIPTEMSMAYVLDTIPFFERVATIGDRIRVEEVAGRIWYRATIGRTSHSLIHVVGLDGKNPIGVGSELEKMGCPWELDATHHIIAVDVPGICARSSTDSARAARYVRQNRLRGSHFASIPDPAYAPMPQITPEDRPSVLERAGETGLAVAVGAVAIKIGQIDSAANGAPKTYSVAFASWTAR
jgi:hypothetical protein